MRILHVTDNYLPFVGGLERAVHSLARQQVLDGHKVLVATAQVGDRPPAEEVDGVDVRRLPLALGRVPGAFVEGSRVFFPTVSDPLFARRFAPLLRHFRPDVINGHGWSTYSVLGAARRAGVPVVNTAHDYGHVCALKTLQRDGATCGGPRPAACVRCAFGHYGAKGVPVALGLQWSSRRHRDVDLWTGVSQAVTDAGSALRSRDRAPMQVVPSYVSDEDLVEPPDEPRPAFVPEGDYLLYVGAIGRHKGVDVLLEAYGRLRVDGTAPPLVLVGKLVDDLDLAAPGVVHQPGAPHQEVMAAWRHATAGVVPSRWAEPFGQVAVECLAAGTPAVVSAAGGLALIVEDGVHGLHVRPGDAGALAAALARLVSDPALRHRLGAAGPARAALFTVSAVAPTIEALYRRVIGANR